MSPDIGFKFLPESPFLQVGPWPLLASFLDSSLLSSSRSPHLLFCNMLASSESIFSENKSTSGENQSEDVSIYDDMTTLSDSAYPNQRVADLVGQNRRNFLMNPISKTTALGSHKGIVNQGCQFYFPSNQRCADEEVPEVCDTPLFSLLIRV